ncbi:hypothetical protein LguiB_029947 [Lonicera macranthoides]
MAFFPLPTTAYSSSLPSCPPFFKASNLPFKFSCNAMKNDDHQQNTSLPKLDRRNILLGLGGLYGTANLTADQLTYATPVPPPDISKCGPAELSDGTIISTDCCPPLTSKIIDFRLPPPPKALRIRPAAHLANDKYVAKFSKAIELMKALPKDDPRNFMQQANIHCAYCNGAYDQVGFPDLELQVHNSWLFFPFHRWYLYFYEKILGKLINDPTFALPFWNWDNPRGMQMPAMFVDPSSSLYDEFRNKSHLPPEIIDLGYAGSDSLTSSPIERISFNLSIMYREMVPNACNQLLFFGKPYRGGSNPNPGGGSIEKVPHVPVHRWGGDPTQPHGEDLGNFYSAGRDTLFYSHHTNVDRMWTIWKTLGDKRKDITDPDWLNTAFLFYDENAQLVRVKIKDCLDHKKLGYVYQTVNIPWRNGRPVPRVTKSNAVANFASAVDFKKIVFPVTLNKIIKVLVPRPKKSRNKKQKETEDEILTINGIKCDSEKYVKFDVIINDEDEIGNTPDKSEFAGSFAQLPHKIKSGETIKTSLSLCIAELLEDLEAEDDESVLVILVPRAGTDDLTIDSINIEYQSA